MPAYNAESTLEKTFNEIPFDIVDHIVIVDDKSSDSTVKIAHKLGIKHIIIHDKNKGYDGNQKSCYNKALEPQEANSKFSAYYWLFLLNLNYPL